MFLFDALQCLPRAKLGFVIFFIYHKAFSDFFLSNPNFLDALQGLP
jgi:hypothetical protein